MRFGEYEIEGHLGAGGMSSVWLARARDGGLVVLKRQLNPADDSRLNDEGNVGLRLRHPNIVQTLGTIEHEGRPMLVLEYVPGASLVALRKNGPLPPAAVCSIGADLAGALAAIHDACDERNRPLHVVHRDVSPANIIVTPQGDAKLIDLGIARFAEAGAERTGTGNLRGTIRYLAPELFDDKLHTPRTDLWALGVCLFEAALGRQAVTGPEAVILAAIIRGQLLALRAGESIEPSLQLVIDHLCAPDAKRFASGDEAAGFLLQAEAKLGAQAPGSGRALAAAAVYAAVTGDAAPARAPAALLEDDAFVKVAATTYCGRDHDDDIFNLEDVLTAPTPVTRAFAPAPVTVIGVPLSLPPTSSPGSAPASESSWTIPQPTTGENDSTEPHTRAAAAAPAALPAARDDDASVTPALKTDDDALDVLRAESVGSWVPIAAALALVACLIAGIVVAANR